MLFSMVVFLLVTAAWLLLDAAAGFAGWIGLRSTPLPPWIVLLLAVLSLAAVMFLLRGGPAASPALLLSLLVAPLLHLGLASFTARSRVPDRWSAAGTYAGHRITAVELPVADGAVPALFYEPLVPPRGTLVLIHGAGAHKSFYTWPMVESLLAAGFAICAIDLAGHGASRRILDLPAAMEDVRAAVEWLRAGAGWVGVVGISLGGCVAARAAAEGLPLDALAILESPAALRITRQVTRNEWRTLGRRATWALHRYAGTLPLLRAWRTEPARSRISTVELIHQLDLIGSVRRARCPVWLCYGGADLVAPPEEARRIAAAAPPGTPLVLIPRATHLSLPLDRRALDALCLWLQQASGTQSRAPERPCATIPGSPWKGE